MKITSFILFMKGGPKCQFPVNYAGFSNASGEVRSLWREVGVKKLAATG